MKDMGNSLTALGVRRPVLITVINVLIMLAGLGSIMGVDVRELPDVDRPIVTVRAIYEGASPENRITHNFWIRHATPNYKFIWKRSWSHSFQLSGKHFEAGDKSDQTAG